MPGLARSQGSPIWVRSRAWTVVALWLGVACSGTIGDSDDPGTTNPGPGSTPTNPNGTPPPTDPSKPAPTAPTDPGDPGRVSLRRLNRAEYNNTVRALLGTSLTPADGFDADLAGFGYDNNGDVQLLTTLQVEQYGSAAEALATELVAAGMDKVATAARVNACNPTASGCIRELIGGLARRAWRRPVAPDEIDRVMRLADRARERGEDVTTQLRFAVTGVLASPHFIFRVELDPATPAARPLDGHEIASRLSYLLHRSMPDDALFAAAEAGRLATATDVKREAERLLADPRGSELVTGFVSQWLDINSLTLHEIDAAKLGTTWSRELAASMQAETTGMFAAMLAGNLPVSELLTARWSMLDARMARHYGLPGGGEQPARVELTGDRRRGLLTHASILTATSNPDRTSPVARGAWVMTHLLCAPPPPPPPDVPALPEEEPDKPLTAREQLAAHRADPGCAACHKLMDPIGLGLENYDAVGRWRDTELGLKIDASGVLPDGATFAGATELAAILTKDPRVADCVARNLYTYALGRLPADGSVDAQYVARIVSQAGGSGVRLRDLVLGIVTSDPFRMRRGEAPAGGRP